MNIIDAIQDEQLFWPYLGEDLETWWPWMSALRCLYGLPVGGLAAQARITHCTGRDAARLHDQGFDTALFLTGRRSGKSRIAGLIGAYEAVLAGHEVKLSKGEQGMVAVCAPTRDQGRIVTGYLRAAFDTSLLRHEVVRETREGFELRNGNRIEILAGDWRTVRGYTLIAAIIDEAAFFGYDAESKVKSDTELIRAIKPALATTGGKLIAISSPYAKKGWCYTNYQKHFGNDASRTLVWNCPSRTMNETLPQSVVDEAYEEDRASAMAEYGGQFRDDVGEFLPRAVIERLVIEGRLELLPEEGTKYVAFADLSGGRSDDAALSIAHANGRCVVVDLLRRYRPPHNPQDVVHRMVAEARRYGIRRIEGDNYAAEWVAGAFANAGMWYVRAELPKSQLYLELLPRLCSGEIELPDDKDLVNQLASLERRTRSGGRDTIDHPPGGHDDLANVIAGVAVASAVKRHRAGVL